MSTGAERIQEAIGPLRRQIINHKVYKNIHSLEDLQVFMQYHVYAVWDFMSLLKCLQINLTCASVPWFPVGDAETRYLINEIVAGEESDVDGKGIRKSHYELYLDAMKQSGADTNSIETFITALQNDNSFDNAFTYANTPEAAKDFVTYTFKVIDSDKPHVQSSVFTFGREDLIPNMFLSIINHTIKEEAGNISVFKYYLERHIEVDGGHHSQLALQMTDNLCGDDEEKWKEAEEATVKALQQRICLWDGVYEDIMSRKKTEVFS